MLGKRHIACVVVLLGNYLFSEAQSAPQHPVLFLGISDFDRIDKWPIRCHGRGLKRKKILDDAAEFPKSYESKYGLNRLELPSKGDSGVIFTCAQRPGESLSFVRRINMSCPDNGAGFHRLSLRSGHLFEPSGRFRKGHPQPCDRISLGS